ncbi:pyocin knob domain-containing protein [Megamonas hypermegale]|uniref:pyocin knob domain-containing protein n=1 Tax=Megamonas hypermegale TaxID=158847 RepID=UPI0026EF2E31|nr:pyocin knob domain-containing protein [Megamonas hypermegale]
MAEKPDFDKIFANKATSVHEWDKDDYDTGWGFLGETPPPYELFDALQRENDKKTKYLSERTEEVNTDLTQDINNLQSDLNSKYSELKTGLGGANTALQQHNVDEDAHANLFKRALVTEAKTASNTADWNTLTESRTYKISGATFAADKHQPVGAVGTGELVVLKNGDDTIAQVYYANSAAYDKAGAYHRMCIGGAWTDWVYNITNKGGTIENNLQINGKLVVPNVYVTEKLLIGDYDPSKPEQPDLSNFLTPEDLQKIQDQIIAPEDRKYVDSINGSDEVGDGTSTKPFRTINKAVSMLNTQVKNIYIILNNEVAGKTYEMTAIDYKGLGTRWENLNISVSDWNAVVNNNRKPILKINEGKAYHSDQTTSDKKYYYKGKICAIVPNISIKGVDIEIISEDTESGVAFVCNNLTFSFNNIELLTSNLVVPLSNLDNTLFIDRDVNINGSNYLVANTFNVFLEDATNKTPINLGDVVYNTILKSNINVTISEDNKKIATGIHPLYTNII